MVATRKVNVATFFKLKRCFDVVTEIFKSHRNQLNTKKVLSRQEIWVATRRHAKGIKVMS